MQRLLVLFIRNQQFSMAALLGGPGVQRVVHLMPCLQHRPPISEGGGSLPCFIQRQTLLQPPALKYGEVNLRADGEEPGIPRPEESRVGKGGGMTGRSWWSPY